MASDDDYQSPKTFLHGNHHASVPKKLRSAIKKRGRESIALPLPIPKKKKKKHHCTSNGVRKAKLNKKKGHITKDEEEVAETLYAMASMYTDAKEVNQPEFDHEQLETKSSAIQERDLINAVEGEESRKTVSQGMIEAASQSSTADVVKSQSLGAQQPKLEPTTPSAAGFQSDSNSGLRPPVSVLGMAPLGEREIDLQQEGVSGVQYGTDDKCKVKFLSSAAGAPSSETQKSCSRFPAWFGNSVTTKKVQYAPVSVESRTSWKRSTAHVYISRLIKDLQLSKTKEPLLENPTQLTDLQPRVKQIPAINGSNNSASSSGIQKDLSEIQHDILLHKRPVQDQQMATETSSFKQGYDFLSLGTGGSVNKGGYGHQYRPPYMQSQDHTAMLFPLPQTQNGHSTFHNHNSAFSTQQVPQYHSSFTGQAGHLAAQLQTHYNNNNNNNNSNGGRNSASILNYAHALFPHLNAALSAKYQQVLPSQHLQLLPLRHQHHLPLNPENIPHLQLDHLQNR